MRYSSALHEFTASIRRVGLKRSFLLAYSRLFDLYFDRKYGIDTAARLELDELEIEEDTVGKGQMYQPTGVLAFRKVMANLDMPANPVLIDYGSGKARTLVLAAMHRGMQRVIGVEFSAELVKTGDANIAAMQAQNALLCPVDNIHGDATKYAYSDEETIFYFFYPFDDELMRVVMRDILASVDRNPRDAKLVYYYPVHGDVVMSEPRLKMTKEIDIYGYTCMIFDIQK